MNSHTQRADVYPFLGASALFQQIQHGHRQPHELRFIPFVRGICFIVQLLELLFALLIELHHCVDRDQYCVDCVDRVYARDVP